MRYVRFILLLSTQLLFSQDLKQTMYGEIFRQDSSLKDRLYIQKEFQVGNFKNGTFQHIFYNNQNEVKAFETVEIEESKIKNYDFSIADLGIEASAKELENNVLLTKIINGKIEQKDIELKGDLVVGPLLPQYILENLNKIKNNEKLFFYIPYFDLLTLIKMEISKVENNNNLTIEMRLSNPLLSFLLPPVKMILSDTGKIVKIDGPTILPDPNKPNSKKTVYTEIIYKYGDFK
ncbi:MAG: hypothetical protein JXR64_00855 [Spirochaetales bacterium]|nr:hypothetical protein [Spirochaetales bacterium]